MNIASSRNIFLFFICIIFFSTSSHSADGVVEDDLDQIEAELDKTLPNKNNKVREEKPIENKSAEFQSLGKLSPFSDIAVIQKRFLPKTKRFQASAGLTTITNDAFFSSNGYVVRFGYHLKEAWAIELSYLGLSTSERWVTNDLRDKRGVTTSSYVTPKSYTGADIQWTPIYGKMSWLNKRIVPFDLYFSLGYGKTNTNLGESVGTTHLSTGQVFAINKSLAFRWDFSWNIYSAKGIVPIQDANKMTIATEEKVQSFNNLFLTVGLSMFFPEASYR